MARKVFISVLGTGNYHECTYKKDAFEMKVSFIQQAMLEYHQRNGRWTENDQVYIFLTKDARDKNWEVRKDFNGKVIDENGLSNVLGQMKKNGKLNATVNSVDIKDGKDEAELWEIFSTIYGVIEEGDEVYFELTHGFRYLPMLVLVFGNYAKFLKKVKIKAITYGNWEMSDQGKKPAPIMDLLPLSTLQDWTFAAANFIENGNTDKLREMSNKERYKILDSTKPILKEDIESKTKALKGYMDNMSNFVDDMKFCRGNAIIELENYSKAEEQSSEIIKKKGRTENAIKNFAYQLVLPVLNKIKESVNDLSKAEDKMKEIMAAKWCFDKGQYQSAVTLLQEGIITYFCMKYDKKQSTQEYRNTVSFALSNDVKAQKDIDSDFKETLKKDNLIKNIRTLYDEVRVIRNDFNHAGMRKNANKAKELKDKLGQTINEVLGKLKESKA